MSWPPDYPAILLRRAERTMMIRENIHILPDLIEHYKHNPKDFIEHWCVTYDPRARSPNPKILPFILFERQREFIDFLYEMWVTRENGLVEKCRDVGATWECCAFAAWMWKFHSESAIGVGSRKEEYVDKKGDPKAIFPKIRQIVEWWPDFLWPNGFSLESDATYMKIINPENGSTITGEAGANLGRGGRTTIYFKDESAHYEQAELIEAAMGDNTDVQIDISSVNGTNNVFYRKRMAGEVWNPDHKIAKGITRVFIFDWRDHPGKTQEWYDTRRMRAEKEGLLHIFAQEVERNYSSAIERIICPVEWVMASIDAHIKLGITPAGIKTAGQDVADAGGDKNALVIAHGIVVRFAEHWGGDAGQAAQTAIPTCVEYGVRELYYDSIGVGAGFKNEINNMKQKSGFPKNLLVMPWNAGTSPLDPEDNIIPGDSQSPTNEEQFGNLKAQSWFRVRARFYKTYRAVRFGDQYPAHELISLDSTLPRLHELTNELSQAQYKSGANGKTIVDKKPAGASSPNLADGLIMCFNPCRELSIFDVL